MNLHEYQAKILLKNNDVRVLNGYPVLDDNDIDMAVDSIQTPVMVVKSQIIDNYEMRENYTCKTIKHNT